MTEESWRFYGQVELFRNIEINIDSEKITANENVCQRYKYGFCKYVNYCNFRREEESCKEKSCHIQTCAKRHPIDKCKFYRVYISAANLVLFCLYSHIPASYVNANQVQMDDFEDRNKTTDARC